MTSFVSATTVDCQDAYALSTWWKGVLGYTDPPDDTNEPGHEECLIVDPQSGHQILFIEVPDPNPGKSRTHFDIRPRAGSRDEEVARLLAHGASLHEDHRRPEGPGWVTLADPEGNLFCVLRSAAEIEAGSGAPA